MAEKVCPIRELTEAEKHSQGCIPAPGYENAWDKCLGEECAWWITTTSTGDEQGGGCAVGFLGMQALFSIAKGGGNLTKTG